MRAAPRHRPPARLRRPRACSSSPGPRPARPGLFSPREAGLGPDPALILFFLFFSFFFFFLFFFKEKKKKAQEKQKLKTQTRALGKSFGWDYVETTLQFSAARAGSVLPAPLAALRDARASVPLRQRLLRRSPSPRRPNAPPRAAPADIRPGRPEAWGRRGVRPQQQVLLPRR